MFISIIEIVHLISYQLCMTWLNWSLKLHSGLWTIPHLILTHNTRDFVQIMSISFVWLCLFKCDVYAQILADQTQKDLWVFYMFFKVILYFHVSSFYSKFMFVFFIKTWFRGCFARSSQLRASYEMCLRKIKSYIFHIETLATTSRVFHDYPLLAKWFLGKNWIFLKITQKLSRLSHA